MLDKCEDLDSVHQWKSQMESKRVVKDEHTCVQMWCLAANANGSAALRAPRVDVVETPTRGHNV